MSEMTTATAAGHLQVTERQVRRLAGTGELTVTRTVGSVLLLDSTSVHLMVGRNRRQGRPWSAATAWAALTLLSGETVDWMAASALSRLRHRLRNSEAADLAWLVRRRATVRRMQGWGDDTGLQRTGVSALRDLHIAALFDLSAVERGTDGYVRAGDFDRVTRKLGMVGDVSGDVRVRVVPDDAGYAADRTLTAAVAVDLMESLDTRESAAGSRVLQGLLNDFRIGSGYLNR
ncbi:DNA-binding protein [Mycobacteroides abscessus subsp. bolletii]|uniref:DNA-binding protein n=1 Tax=Mycobacteroides abscessus TaxID=36809 RepID=UPI0019CFE9E7|nr:DNA-binding protein [Mycobacteroides abscessus]MBN7303115.1 DNA-binding protein [Mycobacteroides abscessus subsp. bolletii]